MAYTIDPANKIIVLDSATVTAQSIYVAWADWMLVSDNAKYLPAFGSAGGDALGGGLFVPPYYFLLNGWRVRPMESNHNLTITGNLFVDGGGVPVVSTVGTYQVNVNYTVPVQAQGISTSGSTAPTAAEVAAAVWGKIIEAGLSATELMRLIAAASQGNATGLENGSPAFQSIDGTKTRINATYEAGTRVVTSRDVT
jgi:hypothetical protein